MLQIDFSDLAQTIDDLLLNYPKKWNFSEKDDFRVYHNLPPQTIEQEFALAGVKEIDLKVEKVTNYYNLTVKGKDIKGREIQKHINSISDEYDIENIDAKLEEGLLTIKIPLKKQKDNKVINIKVKGS